MKRLLTYIFEKKPETAAEEGGPKREKREYKRTGSYGQRGRQHQRYRGGRGGRHHHDQDGRRQSRYSGGPHRGSYQDRHKQPLQQEHHPDEPMHTLSPEHTHRLPETQWSEPAVNFPSTAETAVSETREKATAGEARAFESKSFESVEVQTHADTDAVLPVSHDMTAIDKPITHLSERKTRFHPQRRRKRFSKHRHHNRRTHSREANPQSMSGEDVYNKKNGTDES